MHSFAHRLSEKKSWFDLFAGLILAVGVFALYAQLIVPGVLDGDQGEYQFMLAVLGIPHPSGFPLYLLLGHLWSLLPIGAVAQRINLFSAFWGALTIGMVFLILRRQKLHLLAALGGAIALALVPQFIQFSTAAAVYRLHDFLIAGLGFCLLEWQATRKINWLWFGALAFGLDLANHLTILFLAPAVALFVILVAGRDLFTRIKSYLTSFVFVFSPLVLYLYFPLRGAQFDLNDLLLPDLPRAVSQGVVSPFYKGGLANLFQYVTGASFFTTVTSNWTWKWDTLLQDWSALVLHDANVAIVGLALLGTVVLLKQRNATVALLLGIFATLQLLALEYSYAGLGAISQFSSYFREYYLPSFIALLLLAAWGIDVLLRTADKFSQQRRRIIKISVLSIANVLVLVGLVAIGQDLFARHSIELNNYSDTIQAKWESIKKYSPDQSAALVGHWGDLTPLWYYQNIDGWRRDVLAIHPPTDEWIDAWMATGKPLYLAGPLLNWAPNAQSKYRLTPWGQLVRVSLENYAPPSPLTNATNTTFEGNRPALQLLSYDLDRSARVGDSINVALYWQTLDKIRLDDYVLYLSLESHGVETSLGAQTIAVDWLPGNQLAAGQNALGTYRLKIPWGTIPDNYNLRLVVYSISQAQNLNVLDSDETSFTLGQITVQRALDYPQTISTPNPINVTFGNRIALLGWDGDVSQLKAGDTATIQTLWKSLAPSSDLKVRFELIGLSYSGPSKKSQTLAEKYSPSKWSTGEIVRSVNSLVVPPDLPEGDYYLMVSVENAEDKPIYPDLGLFHDDTPLYQLGHVHITQRPHSFDVPNIPRQQSANFADQISLLGYASNQNEFRAGELAQLKLYWQAQSLMDKSYKVFVHVVDSNGRIWAQQDSVPGDENFPTTGWLAREVITDSHAIQLPGDMPPGDYAVQVGFYDPVSGQRLTVKSDQLPLKDFVILQDSIRITAK
jgi:hypothetical protein